MYNENQKYKTDMICPITGSPLWYVGTERDVMDPDSWYSPESDKSIIFARHPFSYNLFRLVTEKRSCSRGSRFFKLNEDKSWTEMKEVPHGNELFPINTPEDDPEWKEAVAKGIEREKKRQEQNKYWDEHPEEDPRIKAKLIGIDKVEVKPMSAPTGILFYMDYKYESPDPKKMNFFQRNYNQLKSKIQVWKFKRRLKKSPTGNAIYNIAKKQMDFQLDPIKPEEFDATKFPKTR